MNCNHYDCNNRTALGYCNVTVCTNPKYNGSGTYVAGRRIEMSEEERLTERNDDGTAYYPAFVDVLDVESHRDCVVSLIDRLAVYEDTGLPPEVCAEYKKLEDEMVSNGITFKRLLELAAEERGQDDEQA